MPVFVALVVIAEIGFLSRLDISGNSTLVSYLDSFYQFTMKSTSPVVDGSEVRLDVFDGFDRSSEFDACEIWLEKEDYVEYSRDFKKMPVFVSGAEQEFKSCSVSCKFGFELSSQPDAVFGLPGHSGTAGVLRSMESAEYYSENNLDTARRRGYEVVMTTSLSSDVPVGYFSWAEYDIMAPVQPKTEPALAAAFISNCAARNFRLQALQGLEKSNIKIDSYGGCHRNRDGRGQHIFFSRTPIFNVKII
jgi:glycoprotein 3-alpha-L-fucosyltransferase